MHVVLVHSLVLGPTTWKPVEEVLRQRGHAVDLPRLIGVTTQPVPSAPHISEIVAKTVNVAPREPIAVVTHSNAGLFAPAIGAALPKARVSYVFVDARVPPSSGPATMARTGFVAALRAKAENGTLPRWTEWWDDADVASLFPANGEIRETIIEEQPRVPLSWYEQTVDIPVGWDESPCSYIYFGPPYDEVVHDLARRGWRIRHVPGQHLHMVVDPIAVSDALEDMITRLE